MVKPEIGRSKFRKDKLFIVFIVLIIRVRRRHFGDSVVFIGRVCRVIRRGVAFRLFVSEFFRAPERIFRTLFVALIHVFENFVYILALHDEIDFVLINGFSLYEEPCHVVEEFFVFGEKVNGFLMRFFDDASDFFVDSRRGVFAVTRFRFVISADENLVVIAVVYRPIR